jgi:hypothetical protein
LRAVRRTVRCDACRASLPDRAGRCPSCGFDVGAARLVAVGAEITPTTGRRRIRRPGLVALAAVGLGVAVLAVVDQQSPEVADEPDASQRVDAPVPTLGGDRNLDDGGPPATLPGDTGMRVVAFVEPTGLEVTALDNGERVTVTAADGFDAGAPFAGGVERLGGIVTVSDGSVLFMPDVEPGAEAIRVSSGTAVLPSDVDDRVWVLEGEGDGSTDTYIREVDMDGVVTGETTELPEGVIPVGGVTGGLVVDSPDGVFLLDREGNYRRVAAGSAVGAFGSSVVHRACTDQLRCSLYITDVETGERRQVGRGGEIPAGTFGQQGVSPDGRLLFSFTYADAATEITLLDLEAGEVAFASGPELAGFNGGAVWSPDGRWLFWIQDGDTPGGSGVGALRAEDWRFFELDIPGGYGLVVLGPAEPS